jgi:hypothetical protein
MTTRPTPDQVAAAQRVVTNAAALYALQLNDRDDIIATAWAVLTLNARRITPRVIVRIPVTGGCPDGAA